MTPVADIADWKDDQVVQALRLVQPTEDKSAANVKMGTTTVGDWGVPCYENLRGLKVGDLLQIYVPSKEAEAKPKAKKPRTAA